MLKETETEETVQVFLKVFNQNKQTIQSTYANWSTTFTSLPRSAWSSNRSFSRSHKLLI